MLLSKLEISSISEIDSRYPDEESIILDLMRFGLLQDKQSCEKCGREMSLRRKRGKLEWRCRLDNKKDCSTKSVKNNSFFAKTHLPLRTSFKMMLMLTNQYSGVQIANELKISQTTVCDWRNILREQCANFSINMSDDASDPKEIIDESILNQEENQANGNMDLNDDQIAVLLGDTDEPGETSEEMPLENDGLLVEEEEIKKEEPAKVADDMPDSGDAVILEDNVIQEEHDEIILDDSILMDSTANVDVADDAVTTEVQKSVIDDDCEEIIMEEVNNAQTSGEKEKEKNDIIIEDSESNTIVDNSDGPAELINEENDDSLGLDNVENPNNNHKEEEEEVVETEVIVAASVSRKRSNNSPRSPAHKRKRRVHTYFATRQAAINLVTQLLGSYDGMLYRKDLQFINDCRQIRKEQMFNANVEHILRLKADNKKLHDKLNDEKRAHSVTLRKLLSLDKEMQEMRGKLKELLPLLTQPATPEVEQRQFPKHIHMPPVPQYREVRMPPERVIIPQTHRPMQVQRRVLPPAVSSGNYYIAAPQPATTAPVRLAHNPPPYQHQRARRSPPPVVQPRRVAQRGAPPLWKSIRAPATNLGHMYNAGNAASPHNLKDDTDASTANTIMLCVPLIPDSRIYPFLDNLPPNIPHRFKSLTPSAHLTVTINSTAEDFRDNWQIGGRVSYEKLKNLNRKKIQIFVQVSSFKACGMGAHLPMSNDPIEWGISSAWPCKPKLHKFRIRFHQLQQVPENDKVTVFAVAWMDNGTVDISVPVHMYL